VGELPAAERALIGAAARIDTTVHQRLQQVPIFQHCLILVEDGTKELAGADGASAALAAGDVALLGAGTRPDIGNRPDPASGRYAALALSLGPWAVNAFRQHYAALAAQRPAPGLPWQLCRQDDTLAATIRHAAAGLDHPAISVRVAGHRCVEVLAALAERGLYLPPDDDHGTAARVRALIAARPHVPWGAADMARTLGLSEATLRRRLAAENTSFRDIAAEVRLTHGLMLLQTTRAPILQIALDCGYESPSRFASRFRDRFGMSPSELRGSP
jgi:AraC-like DNA-binding protein